MGQSTSREQVLNSLNEITTEAIITSTANCDVNVPQEQNMTVNCVHPDYRNPVTNALEWYEENAACKQCINLARQNASFELVKDVALMRSDNRPVLPDGSVQQPRQLSQLEYFRVVQANLNGCATRCKGCYFSENTQISDFSGDIECVTDQKAVTAAQTAIENEIMQKSSSDKDVFAAITAMMPTGSDSSTSIRQEIKNKVTNRVTTQLLTEMKTDYTVTQLMETAGPGGLVKGQTQQSAYTSMMKTLQRLEVFNDLENLNRVDAAQEAVIEINTVGNVVGTLGNAARRFGNFLISGAGLVMVIAAVIIFAAFLIFIFLFSNSKKSLEGFVGGITGADRPVQQRTQWQQSFARQNEERVRRRELSRQQREMQRSLILQERQQRAQARQQQQWQQQQGGRRRVQRTRQPQRQQTAGPRRVRVRRGSVRR